MLSLGLFVSLVFLTVSVTGSSDGNPLDNDKWMSTVSQYDKSKYWNKFRDVSFPSYFLMLLCVCVRERVCAFCFLNFYGPNVPAKVCSHFN